MGLTLKVKFYVSIIKERYYGIAKDPDRVPTRPSSDQIVPSYRNNRNRIREVIFTGDFRNLVETN
jgi:hypothetical protein